MEQDKYQILLRVVLEVIISQPLTRRYGETDIHLRERYFQREAIIKEIKEILNGKER